MTRAEVGHPDTVPIEHLDLEALLARIPTPVSVVDVHGRQLAASASYARFIGYTLPESAGLDIGRITRDEDATWTRTSGS